MNNKAKKFQPGWEVSLENTVYKTLEGLFLQQLDNFDIEVIFTTLDATDVKSELKL